MTEQQLTDMQFYGEALANVEQQIDNCQKRINHDLMTQVVNDDDCGVPTESIKLALELKELQKHREDLINKISQLAKETL